MLADCSEASGLHHSLLGRLFPQRSRSSRTGDRRTRTCTAVSATTSSTASSTTTGLAYVDLRPRDDIETNARTLKRALRFLAGLGVDLPKVSARSDLREGGQSSRLASRARRRERVGGDGPDPAHWAVGQFARQPASKIDGAPPRFAETQREAVRFEIRAQRPHLPPESKNVPSHRERSTSYSK